MEKQTEEVVVLTVDQLKRLGSKLSSVLNVIELQNQLLNQVMPTRKIEQEEFSTCYDVLYKSTDAMYDVNQNLIETIDDVAFLLLNATDSEGE